MDEPLGVLVTGAGGYIGSKLMARLARRDDLRVVALDVREVPEDRRLPGVTYRGLDIRDPALEKVLAEEKVEVVVHLAAVVSPGSMSREVQHSIDVGGTQNLLQACVLHGVRRVVVSSSGAAYGYHPDHPEWITEETPLRGNSEFAYSDHKRLVEELLTRYRADHPELEQVIYRLSTVLGEGVSNDITRFFEQPVLLGVRGGDGRFVMVWDEDVARCFEEGIRTPKPGIWNVAGEGAVPIEELARRLGKPCVQLPAFLLRFLLAVARPLRLSRYGPEQVRFIQYRPVLDAGRLRRDFGEGFLRKTSSEVFALYLASRTDS